MIIYLLGAFLVSLVCGMVFTPLILDYCKRKKLYDIPNERKVHKKAIPRMGGISFLPSMLTAFSIILIFLSREYGNGLPIKTWSAAYLIGLGVIYLTGIIDDMAGLSAKTKFTVQIATACLLPFVGLYINNLYGLFGVYEIPNYVGIPLTIFIIVFIDNAINLIDGIDGLAAGLSILALFGFLIYFVHYQVFVHTYSILVAGLIDNTAIWPTRMEALIVPITLLFVPSADVVRVTLHRMYHHKPLFDADKNHIHHKLMRSGLSQHQALAFILILAGVYGAVNYTLYPLINPTWLLAIDIVLYCLVNICINLKMKRQHETSL